MGVATAFASGQVAWILETLHVVFCPSGELNHACVYTINAGGATLHKRASEKFTPQVTHHRLCSRLELCFVVLAVIAARLRRP